MQYETSNLKDCGDIAIPQPQVETTTGNQDQIYEDYSINISHAKNGYIVNVGCQTFVFINITDMMISIEKYLKNKSKYLKQYSNNTLTFKHGVLE